MVMRLLKSSVLLALMTVTTDWIGLSPDTQSAYAGDVVVTLNEEWSRTLMVTGSTGPDVFTVRLVNDNIVIQAGKGTTINGKKSAKYAIAGMTWLGIYAEGGKDDVILKDLTANFEVQVDLGGGNDSLTATNVNLTGLNIWGGYGADKCSIKEFKIIGQYFGGIYPWDPIPIEGDGGIGDASPVDRMMYIPGGVRFEGGDGNDTLEATNGETSSLWFFGGAGNDVCKLEDVKSGQPPIQLYDALPPVAQGTNLKTMVACYFPMDEGKPEVPADDGTATDGDNNGDVITFDPEIVIDDPEIVYCLPYIWRIPGLIFNGDGGSDTMSTDEGNDKLMVTNCDLTGVDI